MYTSTSRKRYLQGNYTSEEKRDLQARKTRLERREFQLLVALIRKLRSSVAVLERI